ncbi:MAG: DUF4230 domain-containing protein [Bacteroidia bacterium]|nr:DUF4230 domain-containing protein [Bacteroidia bacterium]
MRRLSRYLVIGALGLGTGALLYHLVSREADSTDLKRIEQHQMIIQQIEALGRIELLQYQVRDVFRKEWSYAIPFARSRLLMILAGEARLCMDFSSVKVVEADWDKRTLRLELPPPILCLVKIDPSQSQVYDANFSVVEWWSGTEAERVREALSAAQETLRVRLSRQFPVEAARTQAETLLRRLCESMGWHNISFVQRGGA